MAKSQRERTQDIIDRFAGAFANERLQRRFIEDLDQEPFTEIEQWAEELQNIAEHISEAKDALEEWADAEDREDKADAKERALNALDDLVTAWNGAALDVSALEAWTDSAEG